MASINTKHPLDPFFDLKLENMMDRPSAAHLNRLIRTLTYLEQDDHKRLEIIRNISDNDNTFDDLYWLNMVLWSVIINSNKEIAYKSKHQDPEDPRTKEDYFVVGLDTPKGGFQLHFHMEFWGYFDVQELESIPMWDGHTNKDAADRLFSLMEDEGYVYLKRSKNTK